jgi:integrase/recombinase XerD
MAQGKQAKVLTEAQMRSALRHLETTRYPERDRVIFLLSVKAGLRAKEIAALRWSMVTDAEGELSDVIALENKASKGNGGGRTIPMNRDLIAALAAWREVHVPRRRGEYVVVSERGDRMTANSVVHWFQRLYESLGFDGCSSHSGRRTFVTNAAKKATLVGGSLRDVQELAGHASLQTTQRYIQGDTEAKRKLVNLI